MTIHFCVRLSRLSNRFHALKHEMTKFGWGIAHNNTSSFQGLNLIRCATFSASDNGASVSHSTAWWGCDTGNEAHNGLVRLALLNILGSFFFRRATNLTNEDNALIR